MVFNSLTFIVFFAIVLILFWMPFSWTTRKIIFPAALPFLLAGMRISLALALVVAVVAEMIAGNQGIGHYLILMQYAVRPQDMYAAILLLALSGYLLNKIFMLIERRLIHWYSQVETRGEVA